MAVGKDQSACKVPEYDEFLEEKPHSMLSIKAPAKDEGGYPCEFVSPPPDLLSSECAVCLQILREPQLISCCGHHFCRTCIQLVQKEGTPCPLCNEANFTVLHDKGLQRVLRQLHVHCKYQKEGCPWTGELAKFEDHLNENPEPEKQLLGCELVEVECIHGCGIRMARSAIARHQQDVCPQRPCSCIYCREYNSIHADVVYRHWPVCKCFPLTCPNNCTVYAIERQHMEHHLERECPLKVIDCEFHYAGCEKKLPRKDMPEHLAMHHVHHTSLLAALNQQLAEELHEKDKQISQLTDEMQTQVVGIRRESKQEIHEVKMENFFLKQELSLLRREMEELKETFRQEISQVRSLESRQESESKHGDEALEEEITVLRHNLQDTKLSLTRQCHSIQAYLGLFPVEFTMPDFEQHRKDNSDWQSPPFYLQLHGYKMCLIVNANGHSAAKETHVSVYACLMRGEFDSSLEWPFLGEITIQLLNQLANRNHATGSVRFTERTPDVYTCRVINSEKAEKGWGIQKFIAHADLSYNSVKNRQYLKDNCLCFRVTKAKLLRV